MTLTRSVVRVPFLGLTLALAACLAAPDTPADITITDTVLRPADQVPPLGANGWGGSGAVEWAANNFVHNSGNEPIWWRNLHRVKACGPGWFEIYGPGTSWWDLWTSGFLSGAEVRVYRLVDADGQPLPPNAQGNNLDLARADHATLVGTTRILPEGSPGFPDGGWVANVYASVFPNAMIRHGNRSATDRSGVENGREYWYTVVAVGPNNQESAPSNEVSARPADEVDGGPHLLVVRDGDQLPELRPGENVDVTPGVVGGQPPYRWAVVDERGQPAALPQGLQLDPATGRITGRPAGAAPAARIILQVTDAQGRSDRRAYGFAAPPTGQGAPEPPTGLAATAGDGFVTLTWQPSPSANVVGYRLKRSTAPAAQQQQRVHLEAGAPELRPWDYVVVSRRFGNFAMKYVNPRVRGIGNPLEAPAWYWNGDLSRLKFSLEPHPQPLPEAMVDPGETCLRVEAGEGEQFIEQFTFIGTEMARESLWYGQLEPGKAYALEVWLRQEGLGEGGRVTFSFGRGYPGLRESFDVTGEWKRYHYTFTGPERPGQMWHFGPRFTFTGPGTLWLDNARIWRFDQVDETEQLYVPNATVLGELVRTQPAEGRKAAHRIWFLDRDATMDSILSWHANSKVRPDWRTAVSPALDMTLPMALEFDRRTGDSPATRMRPWLVMQHILHSEQDWLHFVEYLAAPYDPAKDSPEAKPYAFRRYQQRGVGTPWTEEFEQILLEFGNETWHNGVFDDWLGFGTRGAVHQGGREYGLFTRYLAEVLRGSPYWQPAGLDRKLRLALGANYDGRVEANGRVRGYGEEAMQANPHAEVLGHANYVGPKWETGDYSARNWDDHGVQECLLSCLTGPLANQTRMAAAREALAAAGHAYDIAAYEGGPGGYALPGQAPPEQVETNERYGKSLAQAVGALDAWLGSYQLGWTDQCFLGYGQGTHWNSHTPFAAGFRPTPAWLALTLRNLAGAGDLVAVNVTSTPTIQRQNAELPLIGAYALRDGDRWTVFVLSRKLDGRHDGADFGDGTTPVTLRLPFPRATRIVLCTLTGDPRETNREAMNIELRAREVPAAALRDGVLVINEATGGVAGGLPAGSVYAYEVVAGQ